MKKKTAALILAAGQGTRMKSALPKVLHPIGGVPMVAHAVKMALACKCDPVVVVTDGQGRRVREVLEARFTGAKLRFAVQEKQLGTGDAARAGMAALPKHSGDVLILYGDVPLLTATTVKRLMRAAKKTGVALLTAEVEDPTGYGRILRGGARRSDPRVVRIVEQTDASPEEQMIDEINCGVYVCDAKLLRKGLKGLQRNNDQREYYLTDIAAAAPGGAVPVMTEDVDEIHGINDRLQLAEAEMMFRERRVVELIKQGVTLRDPAGTFVGADVSVEPGTVIGVNVQLYGRTKIGRGAVIEGPTFIKDTKIEGGAWVGPFCHLEGARVKKAARIGPFARLRPEALVGEEARVGNFVEMKKSTLGKGAKANHLAYLGDATIGAGSNVGAGTITCNYDGVLKHRTELGRGVFIGSNATLVAPLELGAGSYVAAGSTITARVPKDALAVGRARQANKKGYAKRLRARMQAAKAAQTAPASTSGKTKSAAAGGKKGRKR